MQTHLIVLAVQSHERSWARVRDSVGEILSAGSPAIREDGTTLADDIEDLWFVDMEIPLDALTDADQQPLPDWQNVLSDAIRSGCTKKFNKSGTDKNGRQ